MGQNVILWIFAMVVFGATAQAADFKVYKANENRRASISNKKPVEFFYEKSSWDLKITQIDKGSLFLRDRTSSIVYELEMTETEPNSSVFSLKMTPGKLKSDSVAVEIYSVPSTMLDGKNHQEVVNELIQKGALKRKPFLLRVLRGQGQLLDIFDDKKDALASYEKYKKALGLKSNEDIKSSDSIIEVSKTQQPQKKKIIDTSTLQSLFLANEAGQQSQQLKNSELRAVLKNIEMKRRTAVKSNGKNLSAPQVKKNEAMGTKLLKLALEKTKAQDNLAAQTKFLKASDLVPHSENLYLQYGLSLHRNKKFNQSIVVLELVNAPKNKIVSKNFFLAMNFYKLENWNLAQIYFLKVMKSGDPNLAPTAAFYLGNAQLKMGQYDDSKRSFQYVLDNSKDPKMDRRAEQYIEFGLKRKSLDQKRSHKWFADGLFGLIYDSNVILALDDQPNINLDKEGLRFMTTNSLKYRPYYTEKNELAIKANMTLLKSRQVDFGTSDELEKADPIVASLAVPWTHRGVLWSRGYSFDLMPGYESIFMDLQGDGTKNIINSIVVDFDNTLVINPKFVAKANYQIRQDDADIAGSSDADATKFSADFSSIIVLNRDAERFLIPSLGWTTNNAKSSTFSFTRIDAAITFTNSIYEKFIWTNKLGYYLANYENTRTDKNYAFTSGLGYSLSTHWNAGLNLNYQINDSTTNRFRKFQGMTTFSYSY